MLLQKEDPWLQYCQKNYFLQKKLQPPSESVSVSAGVRKTMNGTQV
jgi:hypothetical protein